MSNRNRFHSFIILPLWSLFRRPPKHWIRSARDIIIRCIFPSMPLGESPLNAAAGSPLSHAHEPQRAQPRSQGPLSSYYFQVFTSFFQVLSRGGKREAPGNEVAKSKAPGRARLFSAVSSQAPLPLEKYWRVSWPSWKYQIQNLSSLHGQGWFCRKLKLFVITVYFNH